MKRTNNNHCDWVNQMLRDPEVRILTRQEEFALWPLAKAGDERAKIQLLKSQFPLVVNIAEKHLWTGTDIEDLISLGMTGLMKAFHKFDPSRGNRFTTVSFQWIRQAMSIEAKKSQFSVNLPGHLLNPCMRKRYKMTEAEFEALKMRFNSRISLEHRLERANHENSEFSELIAVDPGLMDIEAREPSEAVQEAIATLRKIDQEFVKLRLKGLTYREMEDHYKFKWSRQRIQQRFAMACEKIRAWINKHRPGLLH
jgi:RNA polymerase sigma factor (sigma-70 family)